MSNYLITGSRNNTPHITSMDDASFNAGIVGSGAYILNRGEKLRAEMTTANNCRIYDGDIVAQGRHIRVETSDYIDLTVNNGTVGMKRNDLVVARYENDVETGVESVDFVVIEGTPSANPTDPEYNEGNIFNGDLIVDFPLYRIQLDGISASAPVRLMPYQSIPISNGGTGANTLEGAKNALGIPAIEHVRRTNVPVSPSFGHVQTVGGLGNRWKIIQVGQFYTAYKPTKIAIGVGDDLITGVVESIESLSAHPLNVVAITNADTIKIWAAAANAGENTFAIEIVYLSDL